MGEDNDAIELLNSLLDLEDGLTEWEMKFIEDVGRRVNSGDRLSPAQIAKILQIADARL